METIELSVDARRQLNWLRDWSQMFEEQGGGMDNLADLIQDIARSKGWDSDNRTQGDWAALAHSEISEAFEAFRDGVDLMYEGEGGKPEGMAIEYADTIIRIFHWFAHHNISVEEAVTKKIAYNIGRSFRHGGKAI